MNRYDLREIDKIFAADLFSVAPKNVEKFTVITPEKRTVVGYKCRSRGNMYGSLIIDTVDDIQTMQFIRGMPKIQYYDKGFDTLEMPINNI